MKTGKTNRLSYLTGFAARKNSHSDKVPVNCSEGPFYFPLYLLLFTW